ncbi:MAG: flagellin, partial [Thermodesulfovibrionaceae bacterium]
KVIHYGARVNQVITVGISDVRATALGAYMVEGSGKFTVSNTSAYSAIVTGDWAYATGDSVIVNGINLSSGLTQGAVDAYSIAQAINANSDLQLNGISARASNSVKGASWGGVNISVSGTHSVTATATLYITEGANTNMSDTAKTISLTASTTAAGTLFSNLDSLVSDINSQAVNKGLSVRAYNENGSLALRSEEGKTIGAQMTLSVSSASAATSITASFDLNQIFGGSPAVVSSTAAGGTDSDTGSGIKVGDLTIAGIDAYSYNFTGISTTAAGLGIAASGNAKAYDLTTLNVTTNEDAELALDIINKAIQKVDKIRTQIGSVINNLQAIWDTQKAAYDNTKEAENVIRNTDFAAEMSTFVTMQIRMQAGMAMLAQANALPQLVLQLLR